MIHLGEDELICDLAEVYSIYDYKSYPLKLICTLAAGLGLDSRIKAKQMGIPVGLTTIMIATISDNISNYLWASGGRKGDAPGKIVNSLLTMDEPKESKYQRFYNENELLKQLYEGD